MKVTFYSLRKYNMSRMPWTFYLPRFKRVWSGKIWQFSIFRDYCMDWDFRDGGFLGEIKRTIWRHRMKNRMN